MSFWEDLTMTVRELCNNAGFAPLALPDPDREIEGCYAGDLLSWVMGNATYGCAWITIMTNRNIIAVAALADTACVIVAEDSAAGDDVVALAEEKGINLYRSSLNCFDLCCRIGTLLGV